MARLKASSVEQQRDYIKFPAALLDDPACRKLSIGAKLAYAILLDLMKLAVKKGNVEESGDAWMYYSVRDLRAKLGVALNTASNILKELARAGLVESIPQGGNKPNKIYLHELAACVSKTETQTPVDNPVCVSKTETQTLSTVSQELRHKMSRIETQDVKNCDASVSKIETQNPAEPVAAVSAGQCRQSVQSNTKGTPKAASACARESPPPDEKADRLTIAETGMPTPGLDETGDAEVPSSASPGVAAGVPTSGASGMPFPPLAPIVEGYAKMTGSLAVSSADMCDLRLLCDTYTAKWVEAALDEGIRAAPVRLPMRYLRAILKSWEVEGFGGSKKANPPGAASAVRARAAAPFEYNSEANIDEYFKQHGFDCDA